MTTATHTPVRGARRRPARVIAFVAVAAAVLSGSSALQRSSAPEAVHQLDDMAEIMAEHERLEELEEHVEHEGRVPTHQLHRRDAVEASFARESYRPGSVARLVIKTRVARLHVQILRAGVEGFRTRRNDVING